MSTVQPDRVAGTPNVTPGAGPGRLAALAIFIHSTRSGQSGAWTDELEKSATINWFGSPNSRASTNWLVGADGEKIRFVDDDDGAWHAKEHSFQAISIELTQPLRTTPYTDRHYESLAEVCRSYPNVPIVRLTHFENGDAGYVGHEDSAQGKRDGKSDPGDPFDWNRFLALMRREQEEDDMTFIGIGYDERFPLPHRNFKSYRLFVGPGKRQVKELNRNAIEREMLGGVPIFALKAAELDAYDGA